MNLLVQCAREHSDENKYPKIPIISPVLIFVQKAVLLGLFSGELIFRGAYYWKEFCVSKWVGLDNKNSLKHKDNSLKQLTTASTNSPWAYIREGLLSEGFCVWDLEGLFSGGLIYLFIYLFIYLYYYYYYYFFFWGGGAYYRNFTVLLNISTCFMLFVFYWVELDKQYHISLTCVNYQPTHKKTSLICQHCNIKEGGVRLRCGKLPQFMQSAKKSLCCELRFWNHHSQY